MIVCEKMILLENRKFIVYLKEVPTKNGNDGIPLRKTVRAFIREVK